MTMYNTIGKLSTKDINRLQGLQMGIIMQSYNEIDFNINIKSNSINMTDSTPITQVERRTMQDLRGLLYKKIEFSLTKENIKFTNIKIINPKKIYKINLKLIKKYSNANKI